MPDWDAVIIGGGPAGLTAGLYLSRGNWRTLLIEKESVSGSVPKNMGVPGEEKFRGNGVINCAFCDGSQFVDRVLAVCGGDTGVTEALYMANLASKVILIEAMPELTATEDSATAGMAAQRFLQKLK